MILQRLTGMSLNTFLTGMSGDLFCVGFTQWVEKSGTDSKVGHSSSTLIYLERLVLVAGSWLDRSRGLLAVTCRLIK